MKIKLKAMFTHRGKPTESWEEEFMDTGYVADLIQKLILIAKRPSLEGATLETTYHGIVLYVRADSTVAGVEKLYKQAKNGGMVGVK